MKNWIWNYSFSCIHPINQMHRRVIRLTQYTFQLYLAKGLLRFYCVPCFARWQNQFSLVPPIMCLCAGMQRFQAVTEWATSLFGLFAVRWFTQLVPQGVTGRLKCCTVFMSQLPRSQSGGPNAMPAVRNLWVHHRTSVCIDPPAWRLWIQYLLICDTNRS